MDRDTIHQRVLRTDLAVAAEGHGQAPPTLLRLRGQQQCDGLIGHPMPLLPENRAIIVQQGWYGSNRSLFIGI
jgi:hypothetical protein